MKHRFLPHPRHVSSPCAIRPSAWTAESVLLAVAALGWSLLALHPGASPAATLFLPPERIAAGPPKYQISRNSNGVIQLDATGATLHAVYFSGSLATSSAQPSYVYYRTWTPATGWSPQRSIDDSTSGANHIGGRHPSLALAPDGAAWVAWHDHRHCTPAGNWIDNVEIYADRIDPAGLDTPTDFRVTNTTAAGMGDNSYAPRLAAAPSGRITLAWYDFNTDPTVADLYAIQSDPNGAFSFPAHMATARLTNASTRGGAPSFTLPDLAIDPQGTRHFIWLTGETTGGDLYYASITEVGGTFTPLLLAPGAADFFEPPHITAAPSGDMWIAYGDETAAQGENLTLLRRRAGAANFDPPIVLLPDAAIQTQPDIKVDAAGRVHIVWLDYRQGPHVFYALYDPETQSVLQETRLTPEADAGWARPALALDSQDRPHILVEKSLGLFAGEIWFIAPQTIPASADTRWTLYD